MKAACWAEGLGAVSGGGLCGGGGCGRRGGQQVGRGPSEEVGCMTVKAAVGVSPLLLEAMTKGC